MLPPTVFVVMPYKEPHESAYKEVIEPTLKRLGMQAVRADKATGSRAFLDDIEADIRRCDLVVVEATDANKNVYFELGLAKALQKEVILLTQDASNLPSDTRHLRHLVYDGSSRDEFAAEFERWTRDTRAFGLLERTNLARTLHRGEVFPEIFDATVFLDRTPKVASTDILQHIRAGALINPKYIYLFEKGTQLWLDLCGDPEYEFFLQSVQLLRKSINALLDSIDADILRAGPDIVSLGPGNGIKDRIILNAILKKQGKDNQLGYYYPFDISASMIAHAVRVVSSEANLASKIKIKAAIADFGTHLRSFAPLYQYRAEPNIFLLLGNALGNFESEVNVLQRLRHAMFPGDYVLLEVRTKRAEDVDLGGSASLNRHFDFMPLDALGVSFENAKFQYEVKTNLSQIAGTKTIVASYRDCVLPTSGEHFDKVLLSYIHEYVPSNLADALHQVGFKTIQQIAGDGFVYFLLRTA